MKKPSNAKNTPKKKTDKKGSESGELRKPSKLKPLKEKDKKSWKNSLEDEEGDDEFDMMEDEEDIKLDDINSFDDDDDDQFYDDDRY